MPTEKLQDHLAYPPRAFRAERAAAYLSMSTSAFLALVDEGIMPKRIKVHGMTMWDRFELDAAFDAMKDQEGVQRRNPIEDHYGVDASD
jgi:predicted DNA-binding transcriptional regulator AlpA